MGLYTNLKKCKFHTDTVEYLGFILSLVGLSMDPAKVSAIQDWPEPRNVQDIQSFLGFANFYHQFIHSYAKLTTPLTNLCKKNTPWLFSATERETFQALKAAFTLAPVLCHWTPDLPMTVETDALDFAIAGILSVTTPNKIRPVTFFSHSLQSAEHNYDTHNKELLAIFEAFKSWRHFLEGAATTIDTVMDHKNLEYFTTSKKLTCCQARWSEFLSQFNLRICFRPGRLGSKPDALTHRWDVYTDNEVDSATPPNV